jgi:hypothetical protein
MLEGVGNKDTELPVLLVLNKKDLIKPGKIAKKLEVRNLYRFENMLFCRFLSISYCYLILYSSKCSGTKSSLVLTMSYL